MYCDRVQQILAALIDVAPAWLWKPANIRWVGSSILHFCYNNQSHRTVEFDGRTLIVGRRTRRPRPGAQGTLTHTD